MSIFSFPEYKDFNLSQKSRFLHIALLVAATACLLIGLVNYLDEVFMIAHVLFASSFIFIFGLILNNGKKYYTAASLLTVLVICITFIDLLESGSLYDSGIITFPIILILASFIFSKKVIPGISLLIISGLLFFFYLEHTGIVYIDHPLKQTSVNQFLVIIILILSSAILLWFIMTIREKNLNQVQQSETDLEKAYDRTLAGWAKALELRDQETEGHSRRVVILCEQMASELGLSEEEKTHIRRGALLHDIGKIGIPDNILLKPGRFTKEEFEVIKNHPGVAKELLDDIPFLKLSLEIPLYHHEKWDGTGYPDGLSGENIPLAARIFSVIDVWDALSSRRPYREAWLRERIIKHIKEQSGVSFDPAIVSIFLKLV